MDKNAPLIAVAAVALLAALLFLYSSPGAQTGLFTIFFAKAPNYSIDSLSVYRSDSNVIGSGTVVCSGVNVTGASASCDGNMLKSTAYRFELVVSNNGNDPGLPNQLIFRNVYAASDVLGSNAGLAYCGCLDDGTYRGGTPSFSGDDVQCALPTGTYCEIETSGSETFYFVVTSGSDASSGAGDFFINETGVDDDISAEISFTYCNIACDSNAGCNDGNSLTTDVCSSPGTCASSCANILCPIACNGNAGCNDNNSLTVDTCNNAGTCDANCANTACSVACDSNAGCNDNNSLTTDVCSNPGACSAVCSHTVCAIACNNDVGCNDSNSFTVDTCNNPGICSASCSNVFSGCDIACSSNAGCDDSNSLTRDTCSSPGTCSASCSHSACAPACFGNIDCDDGLSTTVDTCNNAGACDANCTSVVCTPACNSDADCGDGDPDTVDTCIHPGGCGAHCINYVCEPACSNNSDCDDSNPNTADSCSSPGTCDASCSNTACSVACNADSGCDDSNPLTLDSCSNAGACNSSCAHEEQHQLSLEFASALPSSVGRGQAIDLNLLVKDLDGKPVADAAIYLTDSAGNRIDFNYAGNGFYTGKYVVPVDFPLGAQSVSLFAAKAGLAGGEELSLAVVEGGIKAVLLKPSSLAVLLGEKVEIQFRLVYDSNAPVEGADVNAVLNGVSIPLSQADGVFSGSYVFSEVDEDQAVLSVSAQDSLGNKGLTSLEFSVQRPMPWQYILLFLGILAAVLLVVFWLKKTHRLSSLLHKAAGHSFAIGRLRLHRNVSRDAGKRKELQKRIDEQERELKQTKKEVEFERKKQALTVKRLPMESKYALHKTVVDVSLVPGKIAEGISPGPSEGQKPEARVKGIDAEIEKLRERVQNLESEYCKQTIKEDFFRQKLFEFREKIHLLELEKKKIK